MSKKPAKIEWRIEDENSDWPPTPDPALPDRSPSVSAPHDTLHHYWFAAIAFLLLAAGAWLWEKAQRGVTQIEDDVKSAAQIELWLAKNDPAHLAVDPAATFWRPQFRREDNALATLSAINSGSSFAMDLNLRHMQNNVAMIDIVVHGATNMQSYRQTRFYRQTTAGWLRTSPDADQWGSPRRLESTYFIFDFRQEDAQVIAAVAPKVDTLYTILHSNFGLVGNATSGKQHIEVSVTKLPGSSFAYLDTQEPWLVPSPALYLAPASLTNSDLLLQSLAFPLISRVLAETRQHNSFRRVWGPMIEALSLWQLWDLDLPLSQWRQEVVHWRFVELPNATVDQAPVLPADYLTLCAMHALWMASPIQAGIPLLCNDSNHSQRTSLETVPQAPLPILNGSRAPTTLSALITAGTWQDQMVQSGGYWNVQLDNTVALETLLEYIASAYGRKALPTFLAGMKTADDWETLSHSAFGISSGELTAGWQAYLAKQYGVAIEQSNHSK